VNEIKVINSTKGFIIVNTTNSTITRSYISGNNIGVYLSRAQNNYFFENEFFNNSVNMLITNNSNNNTIYHNNFIYGSVIDLCNNFWDNGKEGNYWKNYVPKNENYDGICDIPFNITNNNTDRYPLMFPVFYDLKPEIVLISPKNNSILNSLSIKINFSLLHYTLDFVLVTIENDNKFLWHPYELSLKDLQDGTYNITVYYFFIHIFDTFERTLQKYYKNFIFTIDTTKPTQPGKPYHYDADAQQYYDNDNILNFYWEPSIDMHLDRYDIYLSVNGCEYIYHESVSTNITTIIAKDGMNYYIKVVAIDMAGWENTSEASEMIICDMTAPIVTFSKNNIITNATSVLIEFNTSDTDIQYYEVYESKLGLIYYGTNTSFEFSILEGKWYHCAVRGVDKAGNVGKYSYLIIKVINVSPKVFIIDKDTQLINTTMFTIHWITYDTDIAYLELNINDIGWIKIEDIYLGEIPVTLQEGENIILLLAVDIAGNIGPPDNITITVDTIAPKVIIIDKNQTIYEKTFTIRWSSENTDIMYYEISTDKINWLNVGLNTSYHLTDLVLGDNVIYVRGVDLVNNICEPAYIVITVKAVKEKPIPLPLLKITLILLAIIFISIAVITKYKPEIINKIYKLKKTLKQY